MRRDAPPAAVAHVLAPVVQAQVSTDAVRRAAVPRRQRRGEAHSVVVDALQQARAGRWREPLREGGERCFYLGLPTTATASAAASASTAASWASASAASSAAASLHESDAMHCCARRLCGHRQAGALIDAIDAVLQLIFGRRDQWVYASCRMHWHTQSCMNGPKAGCTASILCSHGFYKPPATDGLVTADYRYRDVRAPPRRVFGAIARLAKPRRCVYACVLRGAARPNLCSWGSENARHAPEAPSRRSFCKRIITAQQTRHK